jgi:hypothetical protein
LLNEVDFSAALALPNVPAQLERLFVAARSRRAPEVATKPQRQKVSVSWLIRHAVDRLIEEESKGLQLPLDMPALGRKKS